MKTLCSLLLTTMVTIGFPAMAEDHQNITASVTVSAYANGEFGAGYTTDANEQPLVKALVVPGPGVITITYVSGMWCLSNGQSCTSANGYAGTDFGGQWYDPLSEATGVLGNSCTDCGALIGAFVPQSWVEQPGFVAENGKKLTSGAGIMPNHLFFVGSYNYLEVRGPGTLYLGINDWKVEDNSGSLNVTVSYSH